MDRPSDNDWFTRKSEERRLTRRDIAKLMGMDVGNLSRILTGKQPMHLKHAQQLATILDEPVDEIIHRAGSNYKGERQTTRLAITASIDANGNLEPLDMSRLLPKHVMSGAKSPFSIAPDEALVAATIRATSGPLAIFDDAVLFFRRGNTIEPSAIGTLALCTTRGGAQFLAMLGRVRKDDEAQITTIAGKDERVELASATPVLAIIP